MDRAFHDIADTKLPPDFAHVAFGAGFVLAHTRVTDHFQIRNLGEIGQDLVLHAVGEVGVVAIVAQSRKWQNGDRFVLVAGCYSIRRGVTAEKKQRDRDRDTNQNDVNPRTVNSMRRRRIDIFSALESLRRQLERPG